METKDAREAGKAIITYLVLTFAFSSVFYYRIITGGRLAAAGGLYVLGLMWCPGLAALTTSLLLRGSFRDLGWGWGKTRYQLVAYALPLGYAGVVYVPVWLSGLGKIDAGILQQITTRFGWSALPEGAVLLLYLLLSGTLGFVRSCLSALGEEIGWRGLLVPQLARMTSFTKTALASGAIWAVWHYPVILFADYRGKTPVWFSLLCFTVMVLAISFAFAWLRLKSGSLWTGMILHASHNLFIQSYFDLLTADTGVTAWITGEFGAGLVIAAVVVGILFWRKRSELFDLCGPDHALAMNRDE
ncbi:MAG: CPBP family intramembrane glutamic endopeptidase [Acidobacteriota bacterium]